MKKEVDSLLASFQPPPWQVQFEVEDEDLEKAKAMALCIYVDSIVSCPRCFWKYAVRKTQPRERYVLEDLQPFAQFPQANLDAWHTIKAELNKAMDALFGRDESRELPSPVLGPPSSKDVEQSLAAGYTLGYLGLLKRIDPELRVLRVPGREWNNWRPGDRDRVCYAISNYGIETERAGKVARFKESLQRSTHLVMKSQSEEAEEQREAVGNGTSETQHD